MVDVLTSRAAAVSLRPATPTDRALLLAIYRSTREEELALTGWSEEAKTDFIEMQFEAQNRSYRDAYPGGRFDIVERDDRPVGRLYVAALDDHLHVIDVALLPEERGQGIGTALMGEVIAEATSLGMPVQLHVEPWSRARRLYERLGFRSVSVDGFYELMVRPVS